ncbi:transposable element Tc1 transposase [Trichonephila clavipes]|nr:transposable element Tc1 transposase [Trichonephila clavipes]
MKSARDDRHLLRMAVNDCTASSRQLTASWSSATGVLILASSICRRLIHRGLRARVHLYRIPLTANHQRLRLQWAHAYRECNRYVHEVIQLEVVPFLQCVPGVILQQDKALQHVAKTVRDFCSAQRMQLLPLPANLPDMSPIEHF